MMNKPLVSVVIIFLNAGKIFFEEAIASVFAQTYENWELLLVDDGSIDISTAIAQQYAQQYPDRIRYLEHEAHQNRGMSASRNLGIHQAKGEYIAFLDADDIWLPEKLERQVAILETYPAAGMVYGSTLMWHSWTGKPEDSQRDRQRILGVEPDQLVQPPTLFTLTLSKANSAETPGTCSVLLRRTVIEEVGGFVESFRGMYEDQAFFSKVLLKVPVFVESGSWDRYRQHLEGSCQIAKSQGQYHPLQPNSAEHRFLKWVETYLFDQNISHPEVTQALNSALFPYHHPTLYRWSKQTQSLQTTMKKLVKSIARQVIPASLRSRAEYHPPVGYTQFGDLRRLTPISREFGYDRGLPIDRYYIENFLARQVEDIQGRVLEIGDNAYTRKFGGDRVTYSDVLHVKEGNPDATIVGDLTHANNIPSNTFDCLVLTQTLQFIYDLRAALKTIYRILKPGGVALVTFSGISQIAIDEWKDYWCWSLTTISAQKLFEEAFSTANLQIEVHGNVLAATSFLQGLATEELQPKELDYSDPSYPLLITVRAVKSSEVSS